jgi:hypothetical protein
MKFLVFDGSKAVNANRRATAEATIDAKVAGAPASRINMKTQQPITAVNKARAGNVTGPVQGPAPAPGKNPRPKLPRKAKKA